MKKEKADLRVNQSRGEELRRDGSRQGCATAVAGEGEDGTRLHWDRHLPAAALGALRERCQRASGCTGREQWWGNGGMGHNPGAVGPHLSASASRLPPFSGHPCSSLPPISVPNYLPWASLPATCALCEVTADAWPRKPRDVLRLPR